MFLCACAFTRIEILFQSSKKFVKTRVYEIYSAFYSNFKPFVK
jgi:hypothetical protein